MTDNTKPEALDLADWLEAVGGGPSAKRCAALLREQHARIAELESELEAVGAGGVQALSAAPATQQAGATGKCMGPRCMASSANGYAHSWECIDEAAEAQGWTPTADDYATCGPSAPQPSPTPPEEQQAEESRVKLLAECRDAFPIPEPSSPLEVQWAAAMARPEEVPEYVRLCVAAMQAAPKAAPGGKFQTRVQPWLLQCFGAEIAADTVERNHRFLEEALELVQSTGCTQSEAHQLVDYVFGRPVGDPAQEVGGVMVTLAALCLANGLDMHNAGEIELARIWTKVEAIRAKQAAKPKHSPLPQSAPQQEAQEPVATLHCNDIGYVWARATEVGTRMRFEQPINLYTAPQPAPAPLSDDVVKDAARYRFLAGHCRSTSEHWGGRWSIVVDGPAPKSHDSEDDFDEAIDAALAAQGGKV